MPSDMASTPPLYSICITHLNNSETIAKSLGSILDQIDRDFEVVVVDQGSTDGSLSFLRQLASDGRISLFSQDRHNRGAGRQLAFEKSGGKYVISNLDLDDIFLPFLKDFVKEYHAEYEGSVVRIKRSDGDFCGVTIFPRGTLETAGGWRDLNWFEDIDVWNRCRMVGPFVEITYPVFLSRHRRNYSGFARAKHSYLAFREGMRAGVSRKVTFWNLPLFVLAWIEVRVRY